MINDIQTRGQFFFVTKDGLSSHYLGHLFITNNCKGTITLFVEKVSNLPFQFGDYCNVVAELSNYGCCIFTNCYIKSSPVFGQGEVEIELDDIFLNVDNEVYKQQIDALKSMGDVQLHGICFNFDNLDPWVDTKKRFNIDHSSERKEISMVCKMHDDILLYENDDLTISLVFDYTYEKMNIVTDGIISERSHIEIMKKNGKYFTTKTELWEYEYKFLSLISFLFSKEIYAHYKKAIFLKNNNKTIYSKFISTSNNCENQKNQFAKREINLQLDELLNLNERIAFIYNWIDKYASIAPCIDLYHVYKSVNNQYAEVNFLWLAQATEALHRHISTKTAFSLEEYQVMTDSLMEVCPMEYKDWLSHKLKYGNEVSFKERVNDMLNDTIQFVNNKVMENPHLKFNLSPRKLNKLVSDIVRYRNYYTHYDPSTKQTNIARAFKLVALSALLEFSLIFQIFKYMGVDDEYMNKMIASSPRKLSQLLRQTHFLLKTYYK